MKLIVRQATVDDIDGIYYLSCKVHLYSYTDLIPDDYRARFLEDFMFSQAAHRRRLEYYLPKINNPAWHILVAIADGNLVGYTKAYRESESLVVKKGLFVDPVYQGRGIGEMLLQASLSFAKSGDTIQLVVIESNKRAQNLYSKHGFVVTGVADHTFYGAKMLTMSRSIN